MATTSEALHSLTTRPLPSPQHGRASPRRSLTPTLSTSRSRPRSRSPAAQDEWWRWPSPTKEDARTLRPFIENDGRAGQRQIEREDGGRVKMLGEWRVGTTVGTGTSGRVRLARSTLSGEFAAVKKVKRLPSSDKLALAIHREISLMKLVEHPHILQLRDVFEDSTHFFLITDYCPHGEVFHYLVSHNLSPDTIYRWFAQLMSALSQLHLLGIAHRDVKFENLFLYKDHDGGLSLKLGDLGMASFQPDGQMLETSCGSPHYAAPEVIVGRPYDGFAADMWSSGIVLYALFARALPFDDEHVPTLLTKIKQGHYEMDPAITGDARDLVQRMLVKDVVMRISLGEVLSHPYLTSRRGAWDIAEPAFPRAPADAPLSIEELEEDVLTNLQVVMRAESTMEAAELVLSGSPRAQHFYSTLARFKTKVTEIPAETSAVRRAGPAPRTGRRRSVSMSDLTQLPRPSSLTVPSMEQMEDRPRSRRGRARPSSQIESAPAETTTYVFPEPPPSYQSPPPLKETRRVQSQLLLPSRTIAESDVEEDGEIALGSAPAQLLHFEPISNGPPSVDPSAVMHPASAGALETSSQSLAEDALSASTTSKRSTLTKKQSFQQRVKGFFKRDESTLKEHSPIRGDNDDLPPASPLRTSFLRRSTGYASLHRAIVALSPSSPSPVTSSHPDSEFGSLPRGPSPQRKKSFARLLRYSKVGASPAQAPTVKDGPQTPIHTNENNSPFLQPQQDGNSPSPSPTPSPTKRRPSPLTLLNSNMADSPRPTHHRAATTSQVLFASGAKTLTAEGEAPVRSPRSPLSATSSNENDPFTLGSPFQPYVAPPAVPPNTEIKRPSKGARIRLLEEKNSALKLEITLLLLAQTRHEERIQAQEKQIEALKAEATMLWRKVEESLEARKSAEGDRDELREMVTRLSFEDQGDSGEGSEKLEAKWMRMLGVAQQGGVAGAEQKQE